MDFCNKVVVITGASGGIGADAALTFAKHSAKLVLAARNESKLIDIASKCEKQKQIKPLIIRADVSKDDDLINIIAETIKTFGRIDVLVNNAGQGIKGNVLDGIELYDTAMNVNVRSAYLLTSLAAPYLAESKGNVVNVSSVASLRPIKDISFTAYCVSKAALDQLTKCAALDLSRKGIRVNSVNPGCTRSNFLESAGLDAKLVYGKRSEALPLGKVVESDEVADLIVYLASDRARSITGSVYVIDNGEMLV
ncbi:uncharacterized oxidoreductase TM_0325-like [Leptidea sinapis]|uniref:uncharacterized oxidoreductase TM_0325-like n=1 Tax=Leptidea sinapis TaxID=189913 RepID=UPI002122A144|nr:uncharacterized oxidoreductase TM_0325-like [Leptidea sinapis]